MSTQHTWTIKNVFGHPLNPNCLYKITTGLVSTKENQNFETEHIFYLPPNINNDGDDGEIINWVDNEEGFVATENLTEEMLWEWIDREEDRTSLEQKNITLTVEGVSLTLPWE